MIEVLDKQWIDRARRVKEIDVEQKTSEIAEKMGLPRMLARILVLREVTEIEDVRQFLHGGLNSLPDPFEMKDMQKAVERIVEGILMGEKILISGDYDSDGCTATSILVLFFAQLGYVQNIKKFIPSRAKDGYGLSKRAIKHAAQTGIGLIISVDCGISAHAEAQYARDLGIDLIISDHHQPSETLPVAHSIINPHQKDCHFPYSELAGCGVAFYLACAVRKVLRDKGYFKDRQEPDVVSLLDLVSFGTIADLVPLTGINRLLTKAGLLRLEHNARPGICALREVSGISKISAGTVGFQLAPRINAAGRLDDANIGVNLFLESDPNKAMELAKILDEMNRERRELEQRMLEHAIKRIEAGHHGERTIVLFHKEYNSGVAGIVASRLVELYNRPVIMGAIGKDGSCKASGRSIKGFHLFIELGKCSEYLEGFGGHEGAAGLSIKQENIDGYAEAFDQRAMEVLTEEDLVPALYYDCELGIADVDIELTDCLQTLEPYGMGNPAPVFVTRKVEASNVRTVGKDGSHLQFHITDPSGGAKVKCIGFSLGHLADKINGATVDVLYKAAVNEFRGEISVQAEVKDIAISED
jgi:single-stranded-DNA-specific exonuclease